LSPLLHGIIIGEKRKEELAKKQNWRKDESAKREIGEKL